MEAGRSDVQKGDVSDVDGETDASSFEVGLLQGPVVQEGGSALGRRGVAEGLQLSRGEYARSDLQRVDGAVFRFNIDADLARPGDGTDGERSGA